MNEYLIALGANLGDREYYIEQAIEAIRTSCGPILRQAPLFETAPVGAAVAPFLNSALICRSTLEPEALLAQLLAIEAQLGRVRSIRWGDRTIDLDIILWRPPGVAAATLQSATLSLPHPEAHRRSFVLEPAAAIAGDWWHPLEQCTILQLWQRLPMQTPPQA